MARFPAWIALAVLPVAAICFSNAAASAPLVSVPRFTHPGAGQTFYFLLTDRFANGSAENDRGGLSGGPDDHGFDPTRVSHYHGGDFAGLTGRLDYLKALGITAVWVTPPLKNKPLQSGTAGYHGYWILDFLQIDPHLGTNEEFREFVRQAHARGMRVYMDIIVNHTADVIQLQGDHRYRDIGASPYRDAAGRPFDIRAAAYNGLNDPAAFPELSAAGSFPYVPVVPASEAEAKHPAWLNDATLYHNRGNTTFAGENSTHGDFVGLDDLFTEHPRVVQGFIEIFSHWIREFGLDGFRIDTAKHVNSEFWQAFSPAIRAQARALGRPDFVQFGEVANDPGDPAYLSEFSTNTIPIDTTLDFGLFTAARRFVSQGGTAAALADFFARDDYYTDHDSNVHSTTTFLGNHDAGRFAYFLRQDNPGASDAQLAALVRLGHGLLYLARGQPVIYYGDEQGMVGRGGNDMQARESMFASQAAAFRDAPLLETERTGADDKFDPQHPFYRLFRELGALRAAHPALRTGAMLPRATSEPGVFAFSRIGRAEQVEYLVALNSSRFAPLATSANTGQPGGARLVRIFDSRSPGTPGDETLSADDEGFVRLRLEPLQFSVWRAEGPLQAAAAPLAVALVSPAPGATLTFSSRVVDGLEFPDRREIRAEVIGGGELTEVTFVMTRASRPGQFELLGVDDNPPYRVFWGPPSDIEAGDSLSFLATANDLRGRRAAARVDRIQVASGTVSFGIRGAAVPILLSTPPETVDLVAGSTLDLLVRARGTEPLEYQWFHDDAEIPGATDSALTIAGVGAAHGGRYRVLARNCAGTVLSGETLVRVAAAGGSQGRIERHPGFPSEFVRGRQVDVWLPPGYDADPTARFPVIYMHDGQNLFEPATSYGGVPWGVDRAMARLIESGRTRGAIVVGVWNTAARTAEYLPQKAVGITSLAEIPGLVSRPPEPIQSDAYLRFLVEEVKPFIDRAYRTEPDARQTYVMGSSMGGLISAYAVVEYPGVFGGAACVSTHWPAGDGIVIDFLARHLPRPGEHRFYFDFGTATLDAGYEPHQRRMDEIMRLAGYTEGRDWLTRKFPGAGHSEKSWSERVEIPLAFLLGE